MSSPARIPSKCAACLKTGVLLVTQSIAKDALVWAESFACACGHGFEARGEGIPAPYAHKALLHTNGHHRVVLLKRARGPEALEVLTFLVGAKDAKALCRSTARVPHTVYEGTEVEASFMAQALAETGAQVGQERFEPTIF